MGHTTLYLTAINYLMIFLFYMLISVPEMIFWVMFMAGVKLDNDLAEWLLNMWISYPGLYGGWVFYFLTWCLPAVQLGLLTTTNGGINQPGFTNAAVQLAMMMISWLFTGIVHTLGFPAVNRKFLRENGHEPSVLPGLSAEEKNAAPTEEAAEEA